MRVLQRDRTNRMYIYRKENWLYYNKLAQVIMEAEKTHDLPLARGKPWKPSTVIKSKSKDLRSMEIMV